MLTTSDRTLRVKLPGEARTIRRGCLHYIEGQRLFASCGNSILVGNQGEPLRTLTKLPDSGGATQPFERPISRLLRRHVYHIAPHLDRIVVMGFQRIWCLDATSGELLTKPAPLVGGRPLALCVAPEGLYYGEYRHNPERSTIRVLFSADGICWNVVREMSAIRHVHGVYRDPFDDSLWLTTGDEDAESAIWRTDDRFRTLQEVRRGSQQVRAIPLLFTSQHVFFGSDTPCQQNYLYRLDKGTGAVTRLVEVEGSVFHAGRVGEWLLFSTAVEPSGVNRSRDAVLYGSRDGEAWRVLARHSKDLWHMRYFQYGQLILPAGNNATGLYWYSTFATRPDNFVFAGKLDD